MSSSIFLDVWWHLRWSVRLQALVLAVDVVSKLTVLHFLERDAAQVVLLNTWGVGVGWVEHSRPLQGNWISPLVIAIVWLGWVAASVNKFGAFVRDTLNVGMTLAIGGALANALDGAFDRSVTDWIFVVSPWGGQAINIADIAIYCGLFAALIGATSAIRLKVCDAYMAYRSR
jgi:lipoprotein signal peptidase